MHIILLSGLSYIGQPISLAWCIGTLIKNTIIIEQQNTKEAERESYRVHQINMLHILHDTIANDLVYTIIELRRVNTEITLLPMKKQIHNIIDILEICSLSIERNRYSITQGTSTYYYRHCCTFIHQYYPTSPLSKLGKKWLHRPYLFTRQSK